MGEIANMISGQARKRISLLGTKLGAGLPTIISGKDLKLNRPKGKNMTMVKFELEKGFFELGICLEGLSG